MNIKMILSINTNYYLRNFFKFFKKKAPYFAKDIKKFDKRIFLLDAPSYSNLGDQAISLAMNKFLKDNYSEYSIFELQEDVFPEYLHWLKKNIKKDDVICLNGGGNMGVLYQKYEAIRRIIIKNFLDNRIIIFPQTYDFGKSKYGLKEKEKGKKIYNQAKRLTILTREEKSYNEMKKDFYNCNVILCPDIVLYLNYLNLGKHTKEMGLCLRKDKEKSTDKNFEDELKNRYPNAINISTKINIDERIDNNNREIYVENMLKKFADCKYVITDRLHGMIFAYITNTPCVALPNSNGKVENVYKWIENKGKVIFKKNIDIDTLPTFDERENQMVDFNELKYQINKILK